MRWLWRWGKRLGLLVVVILIGLLAPVGYVETMCPSVVVSNRYDNILPVDPQRGESRTLLTYPEWHIVHAYDDYAEVIRTGAPHDFGFMQSIGGFWSSLCQLSRQAGVHGGVDGSTKQMVYTIGVSFTAELLAKAAYEETLGRLAVMLRGDVRAPLDDLSAAQADAYATFLQQVPWYRWDFTADNAALQAATPTGFRDRERAFALGIEARVKASYAGVIGAAVAGMEPDALRMRVLVAGLSPEILGQFSGVTVVSQRPEGVELETPRYRAFTELAKAMAAQGADFVEIAGNDDILFTAINDMADWPGATFSSARQGNPGYRHLVMVKVADLGDALRANPGIEHIHDY